MPIKPVVGSPDFSKCGLVVVAAGKGTRFGGYKQLIPLLDKPLLAQTLLAFAGIPFSARVVVLPSDFLLQGTWDSLAATYPALQQFEAVIGREERALSVREGIRVLPPQCEFVAIHDGARPLPPIRAMADCLTILQNFPPLAGAIVASPVTDTIKRISQDDGRILGTENRETLARAETPQLCRRAQLTSALNREDATHARDEASALEQAGFPTMCHLHTGYNPKVTHPTDIAIVTAYLEAHDDTTPEIKEQRFADG